YQKCAEKAAADYRKAADLLPINWDNEYDGAATQGKNDLRINKIMALGYLGKTYLWAASPLMKDGAQVGASKNGKTYDYDEEFAKKAAEVFGELLTLVEGGQTQYGLAEFKYK
ncbi:RagB/SusD family nutrient uptake outer membrane protein, partial [Pseudomonas frederiksbergensis]|nr:RagB/SusD family nutrient uptake outer membrane protein [Pseudomonas frederiksbergensis]